MGLKKRLVRKYERLEMVDRQVDEVKAERADLLKVSESSDVEMVRQLLDLRGDWSQQRVALCDGVFWLATVSQSSGGGDVGRSYSDTPSEWR